MHLWGGLTAAWPGDLLLPDLGCPGKWQEAAGRSCWRQNRRQGQAGLTGISLHHLDQTCMVMAYTGFTAGMGVQHLLHVYKSSPRRQMGV